MTEIVERRIAVTLYRMLDFMLIRNSDTCFIADYADFMTTKANEDVKKYLRNVGCLDYKVRESRFFDGVSAEWKVDMNVFMSLWAQYKHYVDSPDEYAETLHILRTKQIKHDKGVVSNKKHLSKAPKIFTSKHRCKYYINNLAEVEDIIRERYPFWDDIQNKIKFINERNVGLPKISMAVKVKHNKGIVSKVSARYSNSLVSMKAHKKDAYGNTERELYCMKNGLNYEFDVNASIHRLTYMFNHNGEGVNGDVYELIYKKAFSNGKWNKEVRDEFKKLMMRNYFDTSAKNAAKNYINSERKEGRYHDVEKTKHIFELIYPALREIEGKTFDNEIFFWESVIMITLIYEMMQKYPDLKVFSVYDGIYFNKPIEAEMAAKWQEIAEQTTTRFTLLATATECKKEEPVAITPISMQYSSNYHRHHTVPNQTNGCSLIYTLTDKLTISSSVANNVKRNTCKISLNDVACNHCRFTLFNGSSGSSIEMVESRRNNATKGKGIKHDTTNMKGIKHNKTDYADFFKEHPECVTTDHDNFKLAIAPLGLNKSKVSRLWKWLLVNINTVK
jgi:hypothetical protein